MIHDFSLDIETLSTAKNAVILSIGAVYLNTAEMGNMLHTASGDKKVFPDSFYRVITVQDQIDRGRVVDYQTLHWWMKQDPDVIRETFEGPDNPHTIQTIGSAIIDLTVWLEEQISSDKDTINVWVKGVGFDGAIIESLNKGPGKMTDTVPVQFREWQEVRTLERIHKVKMEDYLKATYPDAAETWSRLKHHALADAAAQGAYVYDVLGNHV